MTCPKCGFDQPAGAPDCARCGVIFAKLQREPMPRPRNDAVAAWDAVAPAEDGEPSMDFADSLAAARVRSGNMTSSPEPAPVAHAAAAAAGPAGRTAGRYTAPRPAPAPAAEAMADVYDGRFAQRERDAGLDDEEPVLNGRIGMKELAILGSGLLAAILAYAIPFTRFVLSAMVTLFHEFGHAVAGWLLGMPSLPAFDFVYGGGWTHTGAFSLSIAMATAAVFAYLAYVFRQNPKTVVLIAAVFLFWLLCVSAEWRRELVFSAAGHAAEFILAGILFYKALAGVGWRIPEIERPLGAFIAFFVQINSTMFAWRLIHDADFLAWYKEGKGGAAMNDLEVVALDLNIYAKLNPGIVGVARWLLVFSFVPIAVALIWYFQRARWHRVLRALRSIPA